jgi:hypothetical protein
MNTTFLSFEFTKTQTITIALALKAHACEAYCDERLVIAAVEYGLAAKLFFASEYNLLGNKCRQLALAIDNEYLARAAGDEEEADYVGTTITQMQQGEG